MEDEIQFGEVEEASPQTSLRPDRNKHFAVVEYGSPADRDLPIFVDLDVLADMEEHALSDTSVELGGVLLGSTCLDDGGRPFIVVTDSLRAEHYESTKGSFTFTHDTWSAITRQRDQFPKDLAMVGWYHTHPDWGVFLSGMDMFICDNFFNKPLDLAYVIDPCRGDRGMFQWTGNPQQRVRRTGGFYVTASRFRAAELEHYVGELSGAMPATTRSPAGSYSGAPVVHLHQPPAAPPPAWQVPAVLGMLSLQFCLLALIAWKLVDPQGGLGGSGELAELKEAVAAQAEADEALEKVRLRTELLDEMAAEMRGTAPGFVERLGEKYDQTQRLTADLAGRDSQIRELTETTRRLDSTVKKAKDDRERLLSQIEKMQAEIDRLADDNKNLATRLAAHEPKKTDQDKADGPASERSVWWYVGGGVLAAIVLGAGAFVGTRLLNEKSDADSPPDDQPPASGEREPTEDAGS